MCLPSPSRPTVDDVHFVEEGIGYKCNVCGRWLDGLADDAAARHLMDCTKTQPASKDLKAEELDEDTVDDDLLVDLDAFEDTVDYEFLAELDDALRLNHDKVFLPKQSSNHFLTLSCSLIRSTARYVTWTSPIWLHITQTASLLCVKTAMIAACSFMSPMQKRCPDARFAECVFSLNFASFVPLSHQDFLD